MAAATLIVSAFFVLTGQYLIAIIVVLGGLTIYQLAHQEPAVLPVNFSAKGIKYKGRYYDFSQLKSFWIIENEAHNRLHLQPVGRLTASIAIPMAGENIEKVRDFLSHYLPEQREVEEDLADRINRWLRI